MIFLSTLLISTFTTIALIPLFSSLAVHFRVLDIPDARKMHSHPIPRSGGMAMAFGTLLPIVLWLPFDKFLKSVVLGTAVVVLFGLLDDYKGLSYKLKFAAQVAGALIVVSYGGVWISDLGNLLPDGFNLPVWLGVPLSVFVMVGATNAINLSDGLDGLAGGVTILTFICIAYLAYLSNDLVVAILAIAAIGAVFGFLRFNTYPANLFMGDAGSQFLGFWAICLSLKLTQGNYPYNKLLPLMLLGVPILDTLAVMCERISKRQSPFMPDKNHIHHKLVGLGFSHAETVFLIYMLQSVLITSAYFMRSSNELPTLVCFLVFSAALLGCITVAERNKWLFKRYDFIDGFFKDKLKALRDRQIIVKVSFKIYETALPVMLLFSCLLPRKMPAYVAYFAAASIGLIVLTWLTRQKWVAGILRISLYLFVPYVVYFSDVDPAVWIAKGVFQTYNLAFGVLVLFMILTLKFTRRQKGFKSTPLDFLILFVALAVPNLPDAQVQGYGLSIMATKIIVFFFGYEVLVGELRGERKNLVLMIASLLALIAVRGLFGI